MGLTGQGEGERSRGLGGRRFRRGWQVDVNDYTEQRSLFSLDGRVPWRRLLAPLCRRQLYNIEERSWVDDPLDVDDPKERSRNRMCCGAPKEDGKDHDHVNLYENTGTFGFNSPVGGTREQNSMLESPKETPLAPPGDHETPLLISTAPDGSHPSLKLKSEQLDNFLQIAVKLNDAYHSYILEPRTIEVSLTLSTVPTVLPRQSPTCWSKWASERQPIEVHQQPPQFWTV